MENNRRDIRAALTVVDETRQLNAERFRRPKRYWVMFGLLLSMLVLVPYLLDLPVLLQYAIPVLFAIVIAILAGWKQPTAVRKIRLSGRMGMQLLGFAILAGVLAGVSGALYAEQGWWWVPLGFAIAMFVIVVSVGPMVDRSWARQASGVRK